jgi:transposase
LETGEPYECLLDRLQFVGSSDSFGAAETLRTWVRQAEIDGGQRAGVSTDKSTELKRLRRGNAEPRRANEILKSASALLAAELDRPQQRS